MAFEAMKEAVEGVMVTHKKLGLPVYIEKNGKVVAIPPRAIRIKKQG